ncbi:MAG: hypothetical protein JWP00_2534 [Chloroflexi bacterium]|nr:hypothetical protein [Chloroflexota bacterium]
MLFGASYYNEYLPVERLNEDIRLMKEAGFSFVRMGDSIWSQSEPREGQIDFDQFARVVDAMHEAGIKVVLMTPTYAIPPWLHRRHPEVMARYAKDQRAYYGARQNVDLTHPAYLFYAERIVRAMAERFASHPGVIGWQIDNETRHGMLHNHGVFQRFVEHLKSKFGTVDQLNEIWGLSHWSLRLTDWEDLWTADGNVNPGYDLEWRRFQAAIVTDFLAWQSAIVREYAKPGQFITQDLVGGTGLGESDRYEIAQVMDILSENPYHSTQDGLEIVDGERESRLDRSEALWIGTQGAPGLFANGDFGWSGKQTNFLITEMNGQSMGNHQQFPAYDGQWRLPVYTYISRGANGLSYWHWHSLHYGSETHIAGVLNHDFEPGRAYREVSQIGHELAQHGDTLTDLQIEADVAVLYSQDSRYAFEFQPLFQTPDKIAPDPTSYHRIFDKFYRACFDARAETAIVHPKQDFSKFPLLVLPATYIADDALLEKFAAYAENGGHLLVSFRTGYADEYARPRWKRAPGILREAAGVSYTEYSALGRALPLRAGEGDFEVPEGARAEGWADGLELEGATALAYYDHPHFGRFPAITTKTFGKGRVTYIGTVPNQALGRAIITWALKQSGIQPLGAEYPAQVRLSRARKADGKQVYFLSNWSWAHQQLNQLPVGGTELFSGQAATRGGTLELGPWDMKIVVEEPEA